MTWAIQVQSIFFNGPISSMVWMASLGFGRNQITLHQLGQTPGGITKREDVLESDIDGNDQIWIILSIPFYSLCS